MSPTDMSIYELSPLAAANIASVGLSKKFKSLSIPQKNDPPIADPNNLVCLVLESTLVKVAPDLKLTSR